ncbi:hypothetical protein NDU88_000395 [Pleurodeles waltl]|uniref:Starch-binding domain-containing protein 1 n=1 Tax=Pleurodeles waltl TaxID=8319 RepID=A0AAV7VY07_PLEWA|nr:hypothetical protein NDU88_000395 [Pleurodeles waltl]
MAGGGPHAQTPSSPAGGRGALAEAVGGVWSALVLGLLAAIFAWLWFGGSGDNEDKGAAGSQPGAKPVSNTRKEVEGEEQAPVGCNVQSEGIRGDVEPEESASRAAKCPSHFNADTATETILEPEESFSSNQDFPPKLDTPRSEQCDKNQKDHGDQRAPQSGPAPESVYHSDSRELLEVATSAAEVVQHSVHKSMLNILQSVEEARSSVQNINTSKKSQFTDSHSSVLEDMSCAVSTVAAAQCSMQENRLNAVKVESAQIRMQEGIMNATQAVCEARICVQDNALHATSSAEAVQSSDLEEDSFSDDTTAESAVEPAVQEETEAAALQTADEVSSGIPAVETPLSSTQDSALTDILNDEEHAVVPNVIAIPEEKELGGHETVFNAPTNDEEHSHSLQESGEAAKFSGQEVLVDSRGPEKAVLSVQHDLLSFMPTAPAVHVSQVEVDLIHTEPAEYSLQDAVPDIAITSEVVEFSMRETSQDLDSTKNVPGILPTFKEPQHIELDRAAQYSALVEEWSVQHQDKKPKTEALDGQDLLLQTVCKKLADYGTQEELLPGASEDVRAQTNSNSISSLADEECISFNNASHLSSDNCKQFHIAEPQLQNQEGDSKMRKIAAVTPMLQNVSVKFRVHYITHSDSQLIAVTGNHESLGEWDVFVPLKPDKDGFWSDSVLLPVDSSVEWKFVMVENGKIKRWEECNNRSLKTGHDDAEAHQWWGYH